VAVANADIVLHLTEWPDYTVIDPALLGSLVARRNIIDARCALNGELWRSAGWSFHALGRPDT
jgi:UDPglucose 6-dehydrogenase